MKPFVTRLAIFLAIQGVIAAALFCNSRYNTQYGFMAAFEDKIQLLKDHDEPHLIVVGGSNIIFGIDSPILEQEIGLPTINTGLHAGLGLQLLLDITEEYARPGDVILLIPEYPLLSSRMYASDNCTQELIRQNRSGWKHMRHNPGFSLKDYIDNRGLSDIAFQLQAGFKYYSDERDQRKRQYASQPGAYTRLNFNSNGDFVGHHGQPQADELRDIHRRFYFFPSYYAKTTAAINDCAAAVEAKGAKMYFAYCPVPESVYKRSGDSLAKAHQYLKQHLTIPVLHAPEETRYPESCFYDTSCHLNEATKYERTKLVAKSLQRQFMVLSRRTKQQGKLR